MKMRLQLSLAVLQAILLQSSNAFTQIQQRPSFSLPSTTTKLNAIPSISTLLAVDPADPYANLLEAYAKKGSPVVEASASAASSKAAEAAATVVTEAASATTAPAVDAAVQATQAAAPAAEVATQAADVTTQALTDAAAQAGAASDAAMKAMSDAASNAATKAAEAAAQAAAAAASIAAPSTTAPPVLAEGKAPTLIEYFTSGAFRAPSLGSSNWESTKQGLDKLTQNINSQLGDVNEVVSPAIKATSEQAASVKASATAAAGAVGTVGAGASSFDYQALIEQLHLKEYGGWYVAAAMVLVAAGQRQAGMDAAKEQYEAELALAKSRAAEAADAASVAAEGAQVAKELATKIQGAGDAETSSVGDLMLERSKIQEMMVEKEMMREEVNRLTDETARMRKQLEKLLAEKNTPPEIVTTATTTAPAKASVTVERDPEEDERILSVIKELDEMNKAAAAIDVAAAVEAVAAAEAADKLADEAKAVARAAAAVESEMIEEEESAAETWESEEEIRAISEAAAEKKAAEEAAKKAAEKAAKAVTAKAKTKKAAVKVTKTKKKTVKVKRKKTTPAKKVDVISSDNANPWASLTESTLKRKTVAQLTEYLTERGVAVVDEASGKTFKKAILVDAVQSL